MVNLAELRAKASELQQQGVAGEHVRGGKHFAGHRGQQMATDGSEEVLTKLLRVSLRQATAMDHLQQGAVVVFVVVHEPMQQKLLEQVQLWDQLLPPQPVAGQWVPHPLGERRVYPFATMMEQIQTLPFAKDIQPALKSLEALEQTDLKLNLGAFGPRYPTPKQGRAWVWEMTVSSLCQDSFRQHLFAIMSHLQSNRSDLLKVEPMRKGPQGLRQSLWDDLKRLQPAPAR